MDASTVGTVLQLQSFSVNDGEGIRTVIFLPGCPLRCRWCANPETWTPEPKLAFYRGRCVECGACKEACPESLFPGRTPDAAAAGCTACGVCVNVCPAGALKMLIRSAGVDEVVRKVERDAIFFRHSGGGVTFSGGEPTFQQSFLRALVRAFDKRGIDMSMETCGYFVWEQVMDIIVRMEHVFFDIKHMDAKIHQELTGVSNRRILENCIRIGETGLPLTVRIPFIKEITGTRSNIEATARFILDHIPHASIELLPYHTLGHEKYAALGKQAHLHDTYAVPGQSELDEAEAFLQNQGVTVVRYR